MSSTLRLVLTVLSVGQKYCIDRMSDVKMLVYKKIYLCFTRENYKAGVKLVKSLPAQ